MDEGKVMGLDACGRGGVGAVEDVHDVGAWARRGVGMVVQADVGRG